MELNAVSLKRLQELIDKRKEDLVSVKQFDELFYRAMKFEQREIVSTVSQMLERSTDDSLKIFYDDPYEFTRNPYYAMVQLFIGSHKGFYLDNTQRNPAIKFEGQEFNGKVKIFFKLPNQEKYKEIREVNIQKITRDFLSSLIIEFIDQVYNK